MFSRRRRSHSKSLGQTPRTCIEALESRRLLAAAVWTGDAINRLTFINNNFTNPFNWQGDAAPTAGQDVTFPAGNPPQNYTTVNVDAPVSVGNVEFDATYTLSGANSLTLNGNIFVTGGDSVITSPIVLGVTAPINISADSSLTLNAVSGGTFGINQIGAGALNLEGPGDTYTGTTMVEAGTLTSTTNLASAVDVTTGGLFVGTGTVASLEGTDGQFSIANGAAAGALTVTSNLDFSFNSGNAVNFDIDGANASSSITVDSGTIVLGNAALSGTDLNGYTAAAGTVITLIHNDTGTPIVGTFDNLPEGADVVIGAEVYQISYAGGASMNDCTLTAQQASTVTGAAITLTSSHTPIFEGHTVHLTATVTGTSGTPQGSVIFYENFTPIPVGQNRFQTTYTVALKNGQANLDVTTLPAGTDTITAKFTPTGTSPTAIITANALVIQVRSGTEPTIAADNPFLSTRGYTVAEAVTASDAAPAGNDGLTYNWKAVSLPPGAKAPVYDVNNSNLADAVTVRFFKDGTYNLRCTTTNQAGNSAYVDVEVLVTQKATTLRVEPHKAQIGAGKTLQYVTAVLDQFGRPMRTAQSLVYSVTSGSASGSINSTTGLFSATAIAGPVTIEVADDKLTALVGATVL